MSLQGASAAQATTKGSTIRYPGALPHVNATYSVLGDGLEEVLELQDAGAQASFQFLLKAPKETAAEEQPDGSWVFVLPGHAPSSFWLKPPYAYDSGARNVDPGPASKLAQVKSQPAATWRCTCWVLPAKSVRSL